MFDDKERTFLLNLLKQITISPATDEAYNVVAIVQSIKKKLEDNDDTV